MYLDSNYVHLCLFFLTFLYYWFQHTDYLNLQVLICLSPFASIVVFLQPERTADRWLPAQCPSIIQHERWHLCSEILYGSLSDSPQVTKSQEAQGPSGIHSGMWIPSRG